MNKMIENLLFYKTFIKNAKLPKEYQEVEWISPTSYSQSQRIDTGHNITYSTAIYAKVYMTGSQNSVILSEGNSKTVVYANTKSTEYVFYWFNNYTWLVLPDSIENRWIDMKVENGILTMDGTSTGKLTPKNDNTGEICLFADSRTYTGLLGRMSACKIYEAGELVRNFVPCYRKADDVTGFYDLCGSICTLTGTPFYINSNPNQSQDFKRGADVGGIPY